MSQKTRITAFLSLGIILGAIFVTTSLTTTSKSGDVRTRADQEAIHQESAAPQIDITSPQNGEHIDQNQVVTIAVINQAQVSGVELYLDGKQVGQISAAPYTFTLQGVTSGKHTLTVRAYDSQSRVGSKTISVIR